MGKDSGLTRSTSQDFDPFEDRLARDVRNSLSTALVNSLTSASPDPIETTAAKWFAADPPPVCRAYIEDRLKRYRRVLDEIRSAGINGGLQRSIFFWNRGLFFETHELLEGLWQAASGGRREAIKAMIQAAGVFVHTERGNLPAARRLATRALDLIRTHRDHLAEISNLEDLVCALQLVSPRPPQLIARRRFPAHERSRQ